MCLTLAVPAEAASVARTYSYFNIGGATLSELQEQLTSRGPKLKSSGQRHPGAVEMQFSSSLDYAESKGGCRISRANVTVRAKIILPRWKRPSDAGLDTRLVWGALSGDIKRHEESHVSIARGFAREMEQALLSAPPQATCAKAADRGQETVKRLLEAHDAAQARFDRIEMINFSARLDRLIRYRIEQNEAGRVSD
jgi:predicted secreted Zn-dependent protease